MFDAVSLDETTNNNTNVQSADQHFPLARSNNSNNNGTWILDQQQQHQVQAFPSSTAPFTNNNMDAQILPSLLGSSIGNNNMVPIEVESCSNIDEEEEISMECLQSTTQELNALITCLMEQAWSSNGFTWISHIAPEQDDGGTAAPSNTTLLGKKFWGSWDCKRNKEAHFNFFVEATGVLLGGKVMWSGKNFLLGVIEQLREMNAGVPTDHGHTVEPDHSHMYQGMASVIHCNLLFLVELIHPHR
ncbi:transcription factor MYB113-like [Pyrus ussuriensis x Pyrus communis]|uniref:Transcription factor MYB113-like n=1 Tax=Pyrus ussuriensis x Pyrus communis TaxID=2448454 RepID=A0A5N5HYV2_9ROSA|nr:transcription factor MYB113-like [Pyrus ussuriensis x Pyrus communis]